MQTNPFFKFQGKQAIVKLAAIVLVFSLLMIGSIRPANAEAAMTFNLVQKVPVVYSEFVPCAAGGVGEVLDFSGSLQMFIHGTLTGEGQVVFSAKMVPDQLIGVGRTTGDEYRLVGETGTTRTYTIDYSQKESVSVVEHFRFVAPGPENDYVTMVVYHDITNANGEPVDTLEHVTVECR